MKRELLVIEAAILGTEAFNSGEKRIPCHNAPLLELIQNNSDLEFGFSIPLMTAWSKAWDDANINRIY